MSRPHWLRLPVKVAGALVFAVLTPLLVSIYLVDNLSHVAANFAANEASAKQVPMEKALAVYRDYIETTKLLHGEVAGRLASRADIQALSATTPLATLLQQEANLVGLALVDAKGRTVASAERALPSVAWRGKAVQHPLPAGSLALTFAVPATLQTDYQGLKNALDDSRRVAAISTALPSSYRRAFVWLMAGAGFCAAAVGLIAALFMTRRIQALVRVARAVAAGKREARVRLRGRDEMAELGASFNQMLDSLATSRQQIEYLQRIGAWQDVARRLAHEIKNPLTPIQLAVQQCVSTYRGDDPKYQRLLKDTGEIVEEEIAGLRRLVDTFRTLGQLPKVAATPIVLDDVMAELVRDPALGPHVTLLAPAEPVTLSADKLLLRRVLVNLVENGIHAANEIAVPTGAGAVADSAASPVAPALVQVQWTADASVVTIVVEDRGGGVPAHKRAQIFEPYVTSKVTGTGLGLAISKKIVLEHGGQLELADEAGALGGARMVITLPVASAVPSNDSAALPTQQV